MDHQSSDVDNLPQRWIHHLRKVARQSHPVQQTADSLDTQHKPPPNNAVKKQAVGHGPSPSSSVITAYSNGLRQLPGKSEFEESQDLGETKIIRKRLFGSGSDSSSIAQSPPTGGAIQRLKGGSCQNIPTIAKNRVDQQAALPQELPKMNHQPETQPISQEQLIAEVKGIYAGLVMVEGKCIHVDAKQAALLKNPNQSNLNNYQWQALIALHRTLIHEYHDFFLASQHPSATPAVRKLAAKYAMPARMWRHGIHSFLELLRNRLPDSLDHMLAFIYLAYSMLALFYETVPAFEDTWIECLGDLGRYRMAIEEDDIRDREVWAQVAIQWYLKASDRSPETGRLYHHLAILSKRNALQKLFLYYKALSVPQPFKFTNDSILTLFQPILDGKEDRGQPMAITAYIKVHAILFTLRAQESFALTLIELSQHLDSYIGHEMQKYLEQGYYIAISNCLMFLKLSLPNVVFAKVLSEPNSSQSINENVDGTTSLQFKSILQLFVRTVEIHLKRIGDPNILSFLHVTLVFMVYISQAPSAMRLFESSFPWEALVLMLNTLLCSYRNYSRIEDDQLPVPEKDDFRPTPEEFALRGLFWTAYYFIPGWFHSKNIEDENEYKEEASMNIDYRQERILWLGCQLAKSEKWIRYSQEDHKFSSSTSASTSEPAAMVAVSVVLSVSESDSG